MSATEADNKRAIERVKKMLQYALTNEDMIIRVSCGWDGDTKASEDITPDVARWILDWCSDTLDTWSQP